MFRDPISSPNAAKGKMAPLLAIQANLNKTEQEAPDRDAYGKALSIVAHDLKGPLANLALLVEDIFHCARSNRPQRIPPKAEKADQIIGKMSEMLSAVLERARDGRDPLAATMATINLTEIIDLVSSVNQPAARHKSIALSTTTINPVFIEGDAELLFEAIDNLVGNAIRHSQEGGTISIEPIKLANGDIEVEINDEGPGFSATDLLRAFRPFANLYSVSNGKHGAAGLGLWITRLVIERHGGKISASNREDGGACVAIRLPAARSPQALPTTREPNQ